MLPFCKGHFHPIQKRTESIRKYSTAYPIPPVEKEEFPVLSYLCMYIIYIKNVFTLFFTGNRIACMSAQQEANLSKYTLR